MKTKTKKLELSVVIPVLNEEQNIKELAYEIDKALKNFSHEIIFVDDGSKDDTRNSVLALNNLKQVRLIVHKKCYGQSIAMRSGILKSNCDLIATLDGDGQNDPSDLPAMIKAYFKSNSKLTLVAGIRYKRKDTLNKKIASIFARYVRTVSYTHLTLPTSVTV